MDPAPHSIWQHSFGVLVCFAATLGCKNAGPTEAGNFDDLVMRQEGTGLKPPVNCSKANDRKKFSVDGYLHLAREMTLEKDQTRLSFYAANDADGLGQGRSFDVTVSLSSWLSRGDIDDLWKEASNVKTGGLRTMKGDITEDALHIHLDDGSSAGPKDKLKLVVRTEFLQLAGRDDYSCEYIFVSAHKL